MNAREFAILKHGEQKYGPHPYSYHLDGVAGIVENYIIPMDTFKWYDHEIIRNAGYLHDILEDTSCTYDELADQFGYRTADLVYCITDEIYPQV